MKLPTAMEIRLEMQKEGWISHDKITWMGWGNNENGSKHYGYGIWFERCDWHGERVAKVTYHAHTPELSKIDYAVAYAAELARRAYREFPEYPPHQLADDILEVDQYLFESWRKNESAKRS